MRKIIGVVIIALLVVAVIAIILMGGLGKGTSGNRSFQEAYSSTKKLTFSLGNGSIFSLEESVALTYGNMTSPVNKTVQSFIIRNFSWPDYEICISNYTSEADCGKIFFHMVAFPKELIGVSSIRLPSLLYENLTVMMVNKGLVELEMPWGKRTAYNYTNVTMNYPVQNISTITKLYVDPEEGYVLRGDVSMARGNVSITYTYRLASRPESKGGFQIDKPERWNWEQGSP
jgi:hypothetical protein